MIPTVAKAFAFFVLGLVSFFYVATARGETFFTFDSDPGDYIGGGNSETFHPLDGAFSVTGNSSRVSVSFTNNSRWRLNFEPSAGRMLEAGEAFEGATRYPFNDSNEPGLSVTGAGRGCNKIAGDFEVLEAVFGGSEVERFHASFTQHCDGGPAMRGQIKYDRATSIPSIGDIRDSLQLSDAEKRSLVRYADQLTNVSTGMYMFSESGDYIGQGREYRTETVGGPNSRSRGYSFGAEGFGFDFVPPERLSLEVGHYANATRYPFQSATVPGLNVSGNGRGSNRLTGDFMVLQADYSRDGALESFDALFEQHSEDSGPGLFGRVRWNANVYSSPRDDSWQNVGMNEDVSDDGFVTSIDALQIINEINRPLYSLSNGELLDPKVFPGHRYFDTTGDGFATSADVLRVIQYINHGSRSAASVPEPGAGLMLLCGIGFVFHLLRRRENS